MSFFDQCFYLESVAGDGGNHATSGAWWLSPDIILNNGSDMANPTGPNTVEVRVHAQGCEALGTDDPKVIVDVYVGDPSLVMTPTGNTTKISNTTGRPVVEILPPPFPGQNALVSFTWINGGTAVESPGHKCLIAQCYPNWDANPSATTFDLPAERHVAQRNITILENNPDPEIFVNTINPNPKGRELVTVRAVADLKPEKHVLQAARNALKRIPHFKRLRTTDIPPFSMEFKGLRDVRLSNNNERLKVPNCEARFELKPNQKTKFKFRVDLRHAKSGDAFIFHLTHLNSKQRVIGGLTVVAVRMEKGTQK